MFGFSSILVWPGAQLIATACLYVLVSLKYRVSPGPAGYSGYRPAHAQVAAPPAFLVRSVRPALVAHSRIPRATRASTWSARVSAPIPAPPVGGTTFSSPKRGGRPRPPEARSPMEASERTPGPIDP
mgnify:CR=1 FL=1